MMDIQIKFKGINKSATVGFGVVTTALPRNLLSCRNGSSQLRLLADETNGPCSNIACEFTDGKRSRKQ